MASTILSRINVELPVETLDDLAVARAEAERHLGTAATRVFLTKALALRLTGSDEWPAELLGMRTVNNTLLAFDAAPPAPGATPEAPEASDAKSDPVSPTPFGGLGADLA